MHEFFEHLKNCGNAPAFVVRERTVGYAEFCKEIEKFARAFAEEIPSETIVALRVDYGIEALAAFFALALGGRVVVPITEVPKAEISKKLEIAECEFSVAFEAENVAPRIEKILAKKSARTHTSVFEKLREKKSAGLVLFSSGSTGTPKAMLHDLDAFAASFACRPPRNNAQTFLLFLLFDHIGGLNTLFRALSVGAKIVIPETRSPEEIARLIEREKISVLPTTPTFLNLFLMEDLRGKYDLSSLRLISYGTEPMPEALLARLRQTFPRTKFLQTFGTSETGISQTRSFASDSTLLKIDDPATEYRIADGELQLRTKTQILGYLNAETSERFTADGWFRTGDVAEKHADGFLKIIGRKTDIINVGGEKVFPAEVENVLMEIPEISDCTVFGEANPVTGQTVVARIVPHTPMKLLEAKKRVAEFCRSRLARYKIPTKVILVPAPEFSARFKKIRLDS